MPRTSDASSFTSFKKLSAQSIKTTGKPTQSSAPAPAATVVAAIAKASIVSTTASPKSSVVSILAGKVNTKKRG